MSNRSIIAPSLQQLIKGERSMISMSDENSMMKQILATHTPDGREVDIRPLFLLVEGILTQAADPLLLTSETGSETWESKNSLAMLLEALSPVIDRVSGEIKYKSSAGGDAHATTLSILNMLSYYPWEAKLVVTLAALAMSYGSFWLLAQVHSTNPLAKSVAMLKQVTTVLEQSAPLKPRFDALNNLIKAMMDVSKCIIQLNELPSMYISKNNPPLSTAIAHVPTAVYWTIRAVIACATQVSSLSSMGPEQAIMTSATETWELSTLAHKIRNVSDLLNNQLALCYQYIEENKDLETYKMLQTILDNVQIDNMKILKALISAKEDLPLLDGSTKSRVTLEVLRRKNVLLLISSLDFPRDELSILEQIYNESRLSSSRMEYEIVWIPIVDRSVEWTESLQKQFETLQATMPWYSVYSPSLVQKPVIRFIREKWHFRNKPILVVLDPQGRVVSPNAIHMMWIWGSTAFPFTSLREEALWREETWKLELLVDGIDPTILNWIKEGRYIYLYGGTDMDWIRKFTTTARTVASVARVPLEMVYVGRSNKREQVRKCTTAITAEKISYCWQDPAMVWFFWTRLESMMFSKFQLGNTVDVDPMLREIKKLLSYDKEGGWAVLAKGSSVFVNGHSSSVLPTFTEYDSWKDYVPQKGFDIACMDYHNGLRPDSRPCCRFEFATAVGRIPETMKCPECLGNMEKYLTFLCCHDESTIKALI